MLVSRLLERMIRVGMLEVIDADGEPHVSSGRAWRRRFEANRARIAELFDERFCRMWEFYLALSEAAFRHGDHFVFQMQLAKRRDAVPLTRDYIGEWEHAHAAEAIPYTPKRAA